MKNQPSEILEIKRRIRDLEDKIHDCKSYIASDFCVSCMEMYDNIRKYEAEITVLKELYNKD